MRCSPIHWRGYSALLEKADVSNEEGNRDCKYEGRVSFLLHVADVF